MDSALANATLVTALESWKNGEPQQSLGQHTPPIVVQDADWLQGPHLVQFTISGAGKEHEGTLVQPVTLTLRDDGGSVTEKTVTYLVATSPALSVLRDILE